MKDSHTISLLVADKPGVLVRIALTFARRGFNIDGLVVNRIPGSELSRMTLSSSGDPTRLEQIVMQLAKLIDVVRVIDHTGDSSIQMESALVKIAVESGTRESVLAAVREFRAEVLDDSFGLLVVSIHGSTERVNAFVQTIPQNAIREIVSSGKLLVARGSEPT
ncbi:MAG: acetolactate synthase small subunit [Polyangiaceae bacterium]|jgi:acetolactate synthase-1/3 small subunit